jgi:PAS domain S-box-containing protein
MTFSLRIALTYFIISVLWIIFSDTLVAAVLGRDFAMLTGIQSLKGIFFVLLTSVILFVLIQREIRSKETMNKNLSKSEAQFRYLFEHHPLPMWIYDLQTLAFMDVNQTAVHKYGYSRDEFLSMRITDIRPSEDHQKVRESVARRRDIYEYSGLWRHLLKDGRLIQVDITSHLLNYQGRDSSLVVSHDVTERVKTEQELANTKYLLELIIQSAPAAIYITDSDWHTTLWNPEAERLYGWKAEEVLGKPLPIFPEDGLEEVRQLRERVRQGETISNLDVQRLRKDGTLIDVSLSIASITHAQGIDYIAIAIDITERKRLAGEREQNQHLQSELDKEIHLRQLRNHFISMLSHDVRNPLTGIFNSANLVINYHDRMTVEDRNRHLNDISHRVSELVEILDEILTGLRSESFNPVFNPRHMNLSALIHEIVSENARILNGDHSLHVYIPQEEIFLYGDAKLLRRAVQNLVSNAIKYSPDGGKIEVRAEREDNHALICINDEGIGIPENDRKHLFTSFYRAQNVGDIHGTGLGLVIVKQAVELHGGAVYVESTEGKGTTFKILLPLENQV